MRLHSLSAGLFATVVSAVCATTAATAPQFHDPLDTPARITPLAAKGEMMAVAVAGTRLVAVGPGGRIVVSEDKGKTWRQVPSPVGCDLVAVYFSTPESGWAVGHSGVLLHSTDGGRSWSKQLDGRDLNALALAKYKQLAASGDEEASHWLREAESLSNEGPSKPLLDVWFANKDEGYLVGAFNLIFRTTDGGTTWEPWYDRTDNPKRFHLYAIRGSGDSAYIVGEQGLVLRLDRQAQRFKAVATPYAGSYFGLVVNGDSVLAYGLRGNGLYSANGGQSWTNVTEPLHAATLSAGAILPGGRVVLGSMAGELLQSSDGHDGFRRVPRASSGRVFGITPVGPDMVAVAGDHGVQLVNLK